MLLKGNEDKLQQLRQPNPKKRLIAIVEIKKVIQQKLTQLNATTARELVEPLSTLMRHLLKDENQEVYLEALNLLKFIVGNLAQHLSNLDLHLMMG
jgi:glutamyl-tRNA reductase